MSARWAASTDQSTAVRRGLIQLSRGELRERAANWRFTPVHGNTISVITNSEPIEQLIATVATRSANRIPLVMDHNWRAEFVADLADYVAGSATPLGRAGVGPERGNEPAWATLSSGSTGRPRVLIRSERSWSQSFSAVSTLLELTESDCVLLPAPLSSSLSLFSVAHTLDAGATVQLPQARGVSAGDLEWATVVHCTPHALRTVIELIDGGVDHHIRVALVGGAALDENLRARATHHGIRVVGYYGAAELSFVAVDTSGDGFEAFPGVEIATRGTELWVRSPYCASGYLGSERGGFRRSADGWATVGDRVEPIAPQHDESAVQPSDSGSGGTAPRFRIVGRTDGAILTAAATVVPLDVERVLNAVPGIRDSVVLGVPNGRVGELVATVIEFEPTIDPPRLTELRVGVAGALANTHLPRLWFSMTELPRTSSGKIARAEVARALAGWQDNRHGGTRVTATGSPTTEPTTPGATDSQFTGRMTRIA
jgi:long-chain acyl-CoA synthetase